jgi:PAS domain S-box-containing protein
MLGTFVAFAAIVTVGVTLWQSRAQTAQESERNLRSIGHALSQQTARTLQSVDLTLIGIADTLRHSSINPHGNDPRVGELLFRRKTLLPDLRTILLIDAEGRLTHDLNSPAVPPLTYSDRAYFTLHRDNPDVGLYVGAPVISKLTNQLLITATRRLEKPDGSFNGLIATSIMPEVFRSFYGQMDLGPDSFVALFRNDGTLLVRHPDAAVSIGNSFSGVVDFDSMPAHQALSGQSPIDGVRRIYLKEPVPDSPLFLLVGYSEAAAFSEWRRTMFSYAMITPVVLITLGGLSFLLFRHINRREALVEALQESRERFRHFAESASDRFWETDEQHRFTWHSARQGGVSFIGRARWDRSYIDLKRDEKWRGHKADLDARRPFRDFRYSRLQPDGTIRHRTVSGIPFYDKHEQFKGYRGTFTDITAQVAAEEQATVDRNRFLRAMENLAEGFAHYDADDRLIICNSQFRELNSHAADHLTYGKTFEEFLRACLEKGMIVEARGREEKWLADRMADHRDPPNVFEVQRAGRWYEVREQSDRNGGTLFFVLDIHDQKTTELQNKALNERIRQQFECMPVACLVMSPAFTVIDWNPAAERIFGYSREEMIGQSPYARMIPETARDYVKSIERRLHAGEPNVNGIGPSITKDGRTLVCEWFNTPILDAEKQCIGILSMAMDITEKRKAEEKLRQAQRMEAVGQLTGGIAHDFNNLLQVIFGNCEILVQGLKDHPHLVRWAEMTKSAAERGANLTQRLLAFSRQQVLAPTTIDLTSLVVEFVELLKLTLPENIEITAEVADEISPLVLDVGQLENALLNLALNARDAMPSGGRLMIGARNRVLTPGDQQGDTAPGDYVTLAVTDTGTGMAPHVVKRAFEPFFTTKEVSKGSGLGLSMVYGFVAQSGGQVKIESDSGIGTTVTLWFPRGEVKQPDPRESRRDAGTMPTGKETILVVEDDAMVRSYVTDQLRSLGYCVTEADSGGAALSHFEAFGPVDLLFTDVVMPGGMSGRDLALEVARRYPTTKILFTSGYTQKVESDGSAVPVGASLLTKPYYRHDLAVRVRETLDAL